MTLRIIAASVLLVAFASAAAGQEEKPSPLKKDNPNELHFTTIATGCNDTEEAYEKVVEGELVRARIKRSQYQQGDLFLIAAITCATNKVGFTATHVEIIFARKIGTDPNDYVVTYSPGRSGSVRINMEIEAIRAQKELIRESVSEVLTAYLKANFDL